MSQQKNLSKLVLASASPRRLSLLRQINIEPDYLYPADIDETPYKKEPPSFLAKRLAYEKAKIAQENVSQMDGYDKSYILSADTVVCVKRMILPKPADENEARECLKLLSGRTHKVYTAICLMTPHKKSYNKIIETRLRFMRLSDKMMDYYIAQNEWQDKAGGYAIQGFAGSFVLRIVGSYSSVVGLPLSETLQFLEKHGYPIYKTL